MMRVLESILVSFRNPGTLPKQREVNTLRPCCSYSAGGDRGNVKRLVGNQAAASVMFRKYLE